MTNELFPKSLENAGLILDGSGAFKVGGKLVKVSSDL